MQNGDAVIMRWAPSSNAVKVGIVIVAGLLAHGLVFVNLPFIPMNDSVWYLQQTHLASDGQILDLYGPPELSSFDVVYPMGYPLFVDLIFLFFRASHLATGLTLVQHLLNIGSILMVYRLGVLLKHPVAGFIAALAYALYFPAAYYSQVMMSESLFIFLNLLSFLFLLRWLEEDRNRLLGISGLFLGLATLVRPVAILEAVTLGMFLLCQKGIQVRVRFERILMLISPVVLLTLMMVLHNGISFKRPTLTDSFGRHLVNRVWAFDNQVHMDEPNTQEIYQYCLNSGVRFQIPGFWWDFYKALRVGSGLSAHEADRLMMRMGMNTIIQYPARYLANSFLGFWVILSNEDSWLPPLEWALSPARFGRYLYDWTRMPQEIETSNLPRREFESRERLLKKLEVHASSTPKGWGKRVLYEWSRHSLRYDGSWVYVCLLSTIVLMSWGGTGKRLLILMIYTVIIPPALVEYPFARYREPAVPLVLLLMTLFCALLVERLRGKLRPDGTGEGRNGLSPNKWTRR